MINPNLIGRIAGMLSSAVNQDVNRHMNMLASAQRDAMNRRPRNMSRRAGRRPGCAAEKFERMVGVNNQIREENKHLVRDWLNESEEILF